MILNMDWVLLKIIGSGISQVPVRHWCWLKSCPYVFVPVCVCVSVYVNVSVSVCLCECVSVSSCLCATKPYSHNIRVIRCGRYSQSHNNLSAEEYTVHSYNKGGWMCHTKWRGFYILESEILKMHPPALEACLKAKRESTAATFNLFFPAGAAGTNCQGALVPSLHSFLSLHSGKYDGGH